MLTQSKTSFQYFKITINEYSQIHIIDIENLVGHKPRRGDQKQKENYVRK